MSPLRHYTIAVVVWVCLSSAATAADLPRLRATEGVRIPNWRAATRMVEQIYSDHKRTLYCGCKYSGKTVNLRSCGYRPSGRYANRSKTIEYEHIVPASLMARHLPCWRKGRKYCETKDSQAQARIFDLHNLAPEVGEINALRSDDLYGDLPDNTSDFGKCPIEDTKAAFDPPDCAKGDLARVWFYVGERYGLKLPSGQWRMLERWSEMDPVSPWEAERESRAAKLTGVSNPYVRGLPIENRGSCPWE